MDSQREDLPRISVDTLQDWQRIKNNYLEAAFERLNAELSRSGPLDETEALRLQLQQFVDKTFDMARPNMRVNGRNFEEVDLEEQEEEPFDEGFDRHIWALAEQSLKWDREIAEKRRNQPTEVHRLMEGLLDRQREIDMGDQPDDLHDTTQYHDNALQQVTQQVSAISEELNQAISLQTERSERVRAVAAQIRAMRS